MAHDTLVSSLFPSNEALREGVACEGWLESGWRVDSRVRRGAFIPGFIVLVIRELSLIRENIKQRPSPAQSEPESPSDASYLYIDIVLSGSAVSGAIGMEFGQKVWPIRGKYYRLLSIDQSEGLWHGRNAVSWCPQLLPWYRGMLNQRAASLSPWGLTGTWHIHDTNISIRKHRLQIKKHHHSLPGISSARAQTYRRVSLQGSLWQWKSSGSWTWL